MSPSLQSAAARARGKTQTGGKPATPAAVAPQEPAKAEEEEDDIEQLLREAKAMESRLAEETAARQRALEEAAEAAARAAAAAARAREAEREAAAAEAARRASTWVGCRVCSRVWILAQAFCGDCGSSLEGCPEREAPAAAVAEGGVRQDKKKGEPATAARQEKMQRDLESIFTGMDKQRIRSVLAKHGCAESVCFSLV